MCNLRDERVNYGKEAKKHTVRDEVDEEGTSIWPHCSNLEGNSYYFSYYTLTWPFLKTNIQKFQNAYTHTCLYMCVCEF